MSRIATTTILTLIVTLAQTSPLMAKPAKVQPPPTPPTQQDTTAPEPAPARGQLLYENHCTECHTSVVHVRENRKAQSRSAVRGWVAKWANHKQLEWSAEEIEAVTDYLSERYYKFGAKP